LRRVRAASNLRELTVQGSRWTSRVVDIFVGLVGG
jgi:hypothetical protein